MVTNSSSVLGCTNPACVHGSAT